MLKNSKICFISVTLKSWSGRKLLDPTRYSFTHSMGSFIWYKPWLSCKKGPGALIFIMHGVALSHFLILVVLNVSQLPTQLLGDVLLTDISICLCRILTEFTLRNFVMKLGILFEMFVIYWSGSLRHSAKGGGTFQYGHEEGSVYN